MITLYSPEQRSGNPVTLLQQFDGARNTGAKEANTGKSMKKLCT